METTFKQMGERIRELRRLKGLSQEALADMSNLHRSHMGEIERGKLHIELGTLVKIGAGLQMSVADLVKGIECESPKPYVVSPKRSKDKVRNSLAARPRDRRKKGGVEISNAYQSVFFIYPDR